MTDPDFRAVLESFGSGTTHAVVPRPAPAQIVCVLGAGAVGRLLACEALAAGAEVRLHSVFGRELDDLRASGSITVRGAHLVGTYAVSDHELPRPHIRLEASVDRAVAGPDVIVIATPATAHLTYAGLLAGCVRPGQSVVLVPGRFLGSVVVRNALAEHNAAEGVVVAELAHAPYLASSDGARISVHGVAATVDVAAMPVQAAAEVAGRLAEMLPMLVPVDCPLVTSFGAITGTVGVAPRLTNASVVEADPGRPVLVKDLVTTGLSRTLLHQLDEERREVAFHYGVRDLPSTAGWLRAAFGDEDDQTSDDDLATALADLDVFDEVTVGSTGGPGVVDDVANLLAPVAEAGRAAGVPTPATDAVVALACCLVGRDLRSAGRTLQAVGLAATRPADARRQLALSGAQAGPASLYWRV